MSTTTCDMPNTPPNSTLPSLMRSAGAGADLAEAVRAYCYTEEGPVVEHTCDDECRNRVRGCAWEVDVPHLIRSVRNLTLALQTYVRATSGRAVGSDT